MNRFRNHLRGQIRFKTGCILLVALLGFNLAAAASPAGSCSGAGCCGHCMPDLDRSYQVKLSAPIGCCHPGGKSACSADENGGNDRIIQAAAVRLPVRTLPPASSAPAVKADTDIGTPSTALRAKSLFTGAFRSPPLFLAHGILRR